MANVFRPYIKVTGGTSDALDGETQMIEGDTALVSTLDGFFYIYVCRNSAAAASTPSVVQPVNVTSDLRWHLARVTTQGSEHWATSVGGTANALTATCNPPLTQLIPGMPIYIKAASANTGACTLNVDGLGALAIKKAGGAALDAGDIIAGQITEVAYDGTNFQMLSAYSLLDYAASTGSANAYVLTLAPALPALVPGRMLTFKANFTNTGACTLNVDGLGALAIKKAGGAALDAGDIIAGQITEVAYDGTNFQMLSAYSLLDYAVAGGTANAITVTLSPATTQLIPGMPICFKATFTNTGSVTFNVDDLGIYPMQYLGNDLVAGDISQGRIMIAAWDGSAFQLLTPPASRLLLPNSVKTTDLAREGTAGQVLISGGADAAPSWGSKNTKGNIIQTIEGIPFTTYTSINTQIPVDDTIPQITEGTQIVSASITPTSATSRIAVTVNFPYTAGGQAVIALFKGSAVDAVAAAYSHESTATLRFEAIAGTTSPILFSVRCGKNNDTIYLNGTDGGRKFGGLMAIRIMVQEVAA